MSKRSPGEGTLCRRSNGTWLAQATASGQRISKTFKVRKDAQEWLSSITGQVKQGLTYTSAKTTVNELLASWLETKQTKSKPATNEQYARLARLYILPVLGGLKMQELSAARMQAFYSDMEKQGTGKSTINMTHAVLHGFLKYAQRLGLVAQNWAQFAEIPKAEKRELKVWNESQVSQFLMTVQNDPFYRLAFATGMRRGEIMGLQWKDLNWQTATLNIKRQVYYPITGGYIFQTPKTKLGIRSIRLGPGLLADLRQHYTKTMPLMRALAGESWQELDLMFPSSVGTPRNPKTIHNDFRRKINAAGLPEIRFHDIRHTAATIMLLHGEAPVRVAGRLGHKISELLDTYTHYIQDDQEEVSRLMDEITTTNIIQLEDRNRIATESAILTDREDD